MRINDALTPVIATLPLERPASRASSRGLPSGATPGATKRDATDGLRLPVDTPVHGELLRRQAGVARPDFVQPTRVVSNHGETEHVQTWRSPITRLANERAIHLYQTLEQTSDGFAHPPTFGVDVYV